MEKLKERLLKVIQRKLPEALGEAGSPVKEKKVIKPFLKNSRMVVKYLSWKVKSRKPLKVQD